jgi:pyruvate dehydrogenase E2 component (dihydrolipoamide acetyltransferase)
MAFVFNLPDIGEGIAEAELISWSVEVGDVVALDQTIALVETDKAAVEMPAPAAGTVVALGAEPGATIKVGELLITIDDGSGNGSAAAPPVTAQTAATPTAEAQPQQAAAPVAPADPDSRPKAAPATRRLARELGVDLSVVVGTGPGGRILDGDVVSASSAPATPAAGTDSAVAPAPTTPRTSFGRVPGEPEPVDERIPVRGIRRKTAEAMVRAVQEIPHTASFFDAEFGAVLDLRRALKPRAMELGLNLTLTPFLVKAVALALREHPMANSSFDAEAGEIVVRARRNIGVAAATPDGLVIPIVKDADHKPLFAIAREVESLGDAAKRRQIQLSDLQGGTFTITNHGPLGGGYGTPIIRPPESGILGFGRAADQAVVRDGQIVVRTMLPISYSSDHRIVDGDLALGLCQTLRALIEEPLLLLAEEG